MLLWPAGLWIDMNEPSNFATDFCDPAGRGAMSHAHACTHFHSPRLACVQSCREPFLLHACDRGMEREAVLLKQRI